MLCWIENVAQTGDLDHLVRTGKILKDFVKRRSKHTSPLEPRLQFVSAWSVDLLRLASKWGSQLVIAPWSIYNLIPPFCPPGSQIHKQFAKLSQMSVSGLSAKVWDDRISCHIAHGEQTSALACCTNFSAVGYSSGVVTLFKTSTCQIVRKFNQREHVKSLHFNEAGDLIASGGMLTINVYNVLNGTRILSIDSAHQCLALQFTKHDQFLTGVLRNNEVVIWKVSNGNVEWRTKLEDNPSTGQQSMAGRAPNAATFSKELGLLAVIYRSANVLVWDIQDDVFYGHCNRDSDHENSVKVKQSWPVGVVFNPAPRTSLLAATYWGGELVLFDVETDDVKDRTHAGGEVLACSFDGRLLATGDSAGNVQLFEFDTLKPFYRINSWDDAIRALVFTEDGRRFIDLRGSACNVWEPSELIRQDPLGQNSDSDALSSTAKEIELADDNDLVMITAVAVVASAKAIICGKDDGSVSLFTSQTGFQTRTLYRHSQDTAITHLIYDVLSKLIISADESGTFMAYRVLDDVRLSLHGPVVLQKLEEAVLQIVVVGELIIIVMENTASLFNTEQLQKRSVLRAIPQSIEHGGYLTRRPSMFQSLATWRWLYSPSQSTEVLVFDAGVVYKIDTADLLAEVQITLSSEKHLDTALTQAFFSGDRQTITPVSVPSCFDNKYIVMASYLSNIANTSEIVVRSARWNAKDVHQHRKISAVDMPDNVSKLVGTTNTRLVFIDAQNWLSSLELGADHYARHFNIPFDWMSMNELLVEVTYTAIIFVRRDELAVVRNWLAYSDMKPLRT